jgi:hypothetical protein
MKPPTLSRRVAPLPLLSPPGARLSLAVAPLSKHRLLSTLDVGIHWDAGGSFYAPFQFARTGPVGLPRSALTVQRTYA